MNTNLEEFKKLVKANREAEEKLMLKIKECALDSNKNRDLYLEQNKIIDKGSASSNLINMEDEYEDKDGFPVRILCIDAEDAIYTVVGVTRGVPLRYTITGSFWHGGTSNRDLVKIEPYKGFKVDDKFIVWDDHNNKIKKYFSHLDRGVPQFFNEGRTSLSSSGFTSSWKHFERYVE